MRARQGGIFLTAAFCLLLRGGATIALATSAADIQHRIGKLNELTATAEAAGAPTFVVPLPPRYDGQGHAKRTIRVAEFLQNNVQQGEGR